MSGVVRKLLGGVLAISLFVCSSLSAFAVSVNFNNLYYTTASSGWSQFASFGTNNSGYYSSSLSDVEKLMMLIGLPSNTAGYYTSSFQFVSSDNIDSVIAYVDFYSSSDSSYRVAVDILDSGIEIGPNYNKTIFVTFGQLLALTTESNIEVSFSFYYDGQQVYPNISEITSNFSVYNSLSPSPTLPPSHGSSYPGVVGNVFGTVNPVSGLVDIDINWSGMTYGITNWFSDEFSPFLLSLFSSVQDSFLSLTGNVGSYFSALFNRMDQQEDDYAAVTDPSTSQEIQETQDMIDTVEDFESQLHGNITTEFDKIDFTTPTNLAAPVAYVGDKITRSMNSLGNFQPLIFVPLVLGIMLVMLGRGVSALGHLGSSVARASIRIRSKGGGS